VSRTSIGASGESRGFGRIGIRAPIAQVKFTPARSPYNHRSRKKRSCEGIPRPPPLSGGCLAQFQPARLRANVDFGRPCSIRR
jgi:hypothetical protein